LKEGQYLHCDKLDKIIQELKPKISMLGFPRADIKAEIERLKEPNRINIHLQVNTGEPDIVRKIDISGTEDDIKAVMKLSEGDIFNRPILTTDIERIKEYYKNKEYFKPVIGPYSYIDGTLHISINPGNAWIFLWQAMTIFPARPCSKRCLFLRLKTLMLIL
jgi:outer membrane protein assembly factor BamA